jgi:hypothetical protein
MKLLAFLLAISGYFSTSTIHILPSFSVRLECALFQSLFLSVSAYEILLFKVPFLLFVKTIMDMGFTWILRFFTFVLLVFAQILISDQQFVLVVTFFN